jgi:hypothetical protein
VGWAYLECPLQDAWEEGHCTGSPYANDPASLCHQGQFPDFRLEPHWRARMLSFPLPYPADPWFALCAVAKVSGTVPLLLVPLSFYARTVSQHVIPSTTYDPQMQI